MRLVLKYCQIDAPFMICLTWLRGKTNTDGRFGGRTNVAIFTRDIIIEVWQWLCGVVSGSIRSITQLSWELCSQPSSVQHTRQRFVAISRHLARSSLIQSAKAMHIYIETCRPSSAWYPRNWRCFYVCAITLSILISSLCKKNKKIFDVWNDRDCSRS